MIAKIFNKYFIFIIFFSFLHITNSYAHEIKQTISLLLGDSHTKIAIDAIKDIENQYPQIKKHIKFEIFTSDSISGKVAEQKTIFILFLMNTKLVQKAKPYVLSVIKNTGKVYGVSEPYEKEYEEIGIISDETINKYFRYNGHENIKNMLLYIINKDTYLKVLYEPPKEIPEIGIYLKEKKKIVKNIEEFLNFYKEKKGASWIGITFYRDYFTTDNMAHIDAIIDSLELEGFNVFPVFGWPIEKALEKFFIKNKKFKIQLIVGISLKLRIIPEKIIPIFKKIGVPVINAISLYTQTEKQWNNSKKGLDIFERAWQVATPELGGIIQPMVIASKEKFLDKQTGVVYKKIMPIKERVRMLTKRVKTWINLRKKDNSKKHIAILYYNYPPGKQNIGASYLNVLPESLYEILKRLKKEGYNTGNKEIEKNKLFYEIFNYGRNIGNWAEAEIDKMVNTSKDNVVLIPLDTYKRWFEELPENFKKKVIKSWGYPEETNIMFWKKRFIVIPAVKYGNILFTPQPARGWMQDIEKLYHDIKLPPHHQYIAFYLYLKKVFKADAIVHVGTHGTLEWLPMKEVGLSKDDAGEVLLQDIPNIYPYIVDDVGEGIQAKRRSMAVIIDHMTPPFDKAGLNPRLKELLELINDYEVAKTKNPSLANTKLKEINLLSKKIGILNDIGLKELKKDEDISMLADYLRETNEKLTPFGLHTFGKISKKNVQILSKTIVSIEKGLSLKEKNQKIKEISSIINKSAKREMDSLIAALSGKYIPSGIGGDPIRNPDSLPTGKNFYAFDPTKIPSKAIYNIGVKMAKELIEKYKEKHGTYPDKMTFNLWAVETIRSEGIMESQIMYLLGVKPIWNNRGRVKGVVAISREELKRPRIDVTIIPSGLYRDLFSNLMELLDRAVTVAKTQKEKDNFLRINMNKIKQRLIKAGISEKEAEKLASVRIFTEPSGAYGTGLSEIINKSDKWDKELKVVEVFFRRMGYIYGQGFWGEKSSIKSIDLLKNALSGSKMVVHSRSSNLYASLDNDDMFQYLGGTAMAIRSIDGKSPEVYITNLSNPTKPKQESINKFMGQEMRTRYFNPKWIKAMMNEGYAGARFIDKIVEHLWGWQVTLPEAVDGTKWQQIYEIYVLDKQGLKIKEMFKKANNLFAYQSMLARMLEVVRKGYWQPNKEVIEKILNEYIKTVEEAGLTCCDHTCNNPLLTEFIKNLLISIPSLEPKAKLLTNKLKSISKSKYTGHVMAQAKASSPDNKPVVVEGYEMKEVNKDKGTSSAPIPYLYIIGFLVFVILIMIGWKKRL